MTSMVILVVLENSSKEILPNIDQVAIKEENSSEILLPMNVPMESNIEADLSPLETSSSHNPSSSDHPSIASQLIPESASSSRSNSRTSSETKTETIKVNSTELPKLIDIFFSKNISASTSSTTLKYHVYFSPKNSITPTSSNLNSTKIKPKRKMNEEMKDESEHDNQLDVPLSSTTEQSKNSSASTAPVTRRSISTRSIPNSAAEQEEEKSRRYFLHSVRFDL